jgi:hypothetical protein
MKSTIFLIIILLVSSPTFSQNSFIVTDEDIEFKTAEEKKLFNTALENKSSASILPLLMYSYEPSSVTVDEANAKIERSIKYISENFIKTKTDAKRIKQIYDYVHQEFLVLYKFENSFCEIFKNGNYNCVSASALYSVIFSRLGIPYMIKELPTHVYLIAYPSSSNIVIETTSPNYGYYKFSEIFIEQYVKQLASGKQISQKELDTSSVENIFKRYFYDKGEIDLLKLTALQFNNFGIYLSDKKDYREAIEWLKKAYILYPSERISFTLKNALLNAISASGNMMDDKSLNLYLLYIHFNSKDNKEFKDENVKKIVSTVSEDLLIAKSDLVGFKSFYGKVEKTLKDSTLNKELAFIYYYQLARYSVLNGKTDSVEVYFDKAYHLNTDNSYLKALILEYTMNRLNTYMDVNRIYKLLISSKDKFPFLSETENFNYVLANCYLEYSFQNFSNRNAKKGEEYLTKFETLVQEKNILYANEKFISKAYSEAAVYYYRVGDKTKAKGKIKSGLKYYPENFKLMEIQKQMN